MSDINDGGPAFPVQASYPYGPSDGMSLRDWLAGMALQGLLSRSDPDEDWATRYECFSEDAYLYADAMLAHRGTPDQRLKQLRDALQNLLDCVVNDDLVPESVSYLQQARKALADVPAESV